jgi:uncharacterized metal-binding protein
MIISSDVEKEVLNLYKTDNFIKNTTREASIVEATGYLIWPRLKDTIEFAKGMGFNKIGLAFCVGLRNEAKKVAEILNKYGFEVTAVCCKTGSIAKTELGVPKEYTILSKTGHPLGFVSCNPVAQALLLNKSETDLNLIVGLCVGHDITFTQLSKAPVSTLIAKDRSNPHSPAAILYTPYGDSYFAKDIKASKKKRK